MKLTKVVCSESQPKILETVSKLKTCHQVHDCDEFPPRYNQYFHSYSNNTAQLHNCTTNFLFVTMVTDVRGECFC